MRRDGRELDAICILVTLPAALGGVFLGVEVLSLFGTKDLGKTVQYNDIRGA